jgi:hypothetical protein
MPGIHDVQQKVCNFFKTEMGKEREALHFIKVGKAEAGWEVRVEVTEQNEYLKKIGYPSIFDKNIYTVELDQDLAITSFVLGASRERSYATEEREEM